MKLTSLPYPFISWYWQSYADGCECPSYVRYDQQSEYGCSHWEYWNGHGDIVMDELKPWLFENKSLDEIQVLLAKWINDENDINKRYNEYYTQTIKDITKEEEVKYEGTPPSDGFDLSSFILTSCG